MEEMNGLTMSQDSPTAEVTETPDVSTEVTGTEVTDTFANPKKNKTKDVSERINAIRAESDARVKVLEEKLKGYEDQLYRYRSEELGCSEDELRAEDMRINTEFEQKMRNHPEYKQLLARDFEHRKHEVLVELQSAFPEENIESIEDLDQQFFRMLQAGVTPANAYRAAVVGNRKEKPPTTGSVKSAPETDGGTYTLEQIKNMSRAEILKNYDKVEKSLTRR